MKYGISYAESGGNPTCTCDDLKRDQNQPLEKYATYDSLGGFFWWKEHFMFIKRYVVQNQRTNTNNTVLVAWHVYSIRVIAHDGLNIDFEDDEYELHWQRPPQTLVTDSNGDIVVKGFEHFEWCRSYVPKRIADDVRTVEERSNSILRKYHEHVRKTETG